MSPKIVITIEKKCSICHVKIIYIKEMDDSNKFNCIVKIYLIFFSELGADKNIYATAAKTINLCQEINRYAKCSLLTRKKKQMRSWWDIFI